MFACSLSLPRRKLFFSSLSLPRYIIAPQQSNIFKHSLISRTKKRSIYETPAVPRVCPPYHIWWENGRKVVLSDCTSIRLIWQKTGGGGHNHLAVGGLCFTGSFWNGLGRKRIYQDQGWSGQAQIMVNCFCSFMVAQRNEKLKPNNTKLFLFLLICLYILKFWFWSSGSSLCRESKVKVKKKSRDFNWFRASGTECVQ